MMGKQKKLKLGTLLAFALCLTALPSEAKRLGSGKSVDQQAPAQPTAAQPKQRQAEADGGDAAAKVSSGALTLRPRVGGTTHAVAGAVAVGAAGAVAAGTASAEQQRQAEQRQQEEQRRQDQLAEERARMRAEELAKKVEEAARQEVKAIQLAEAARAADEAAALRRKAEERRQAETALQKVKVERELSCVIKPVMTDTEIEHCKTVWR